MNLLIVRIAASRVETGDSAVSGTNAHRMERYMNAARMELALALNYLNVPIDLATFSKRFNLQKKIYLAQIAGVDLGYRFGWYIHGPYCKSLTEDLFTLRDELAEGDREYEDYQLEPTVTA